MKKFIKGYNKVYSIDDQGNVYRYDKLMKPCDNGTGYLQIKLRKNGQRKHIYIHRLVYETFIGEIPDNYEINHKDHNKQNNKLSNLELVTRSENLIKAIQFHGYFGFLKKYISKYKK